jgi:hypothetical protein
MRADVQEPDVRPTASDEPANDVRSPYPSRTPVGKSGGCASKAVELTSGDLPLVSESRLRVERSVLTGRQKSAEGKVARIAWETRTERRPERSP